MTSRIDASQATQGSILIVEDEPELLEPLEYSLRKAGFATASAADGLNACRRVGSFRPELILLDILLPDLDGWEVCRMIRSHPDPILASTPIIMMTALTSTENRLKGLELGADAYLPKPYAMREVILHARNLVARRRRQEQLRTEMEQARQREDLQNDIQAMLCHELRNHLLVIGGFSALLSREVPSLEQDKSLDHLAAIRRSSDYLAQLAEEFLLLRRVRDGRLQLPPQAVGLETMVQGISQLFQPLSRERGVALRVEGAGGIGTVYLNPTALRMVLANLVSNALLYSPAGSLVTLSVGPVGTDLFCLQVSDQGPGIALEEQQDIFQRFYRGRAQSSTVAGSGLGLYIARTLVEAMAGRIELNSRPGQGSCFNVVLPLFSTADAPPSSSQ